MAGPGKVGEARRLQSLVLLPMSTTRACSGYVASEGTWKIPQGLCVSVASLTAARPARPAVQRRWRKCNNVWRMMLKGEEERIDTQAIAQGAARGSLMSVN